MVYWWMKNRMEPLDAWAAINHPLQPWMLKAHILVAPLMVFAPLIVSGYVIQVVTDVGWLEALAWAHLGTGVVYLAGLAAHHRVFRRVSAPSREGPNATSTSHAFTRPSRSELSVTASDTPMSPTSTAVISDT